MQREYNISISIFWLSGLVLMTENLFTYKWYIFYKKITLARKLLKITIYNIYFVHLIKKYSFSNKYSTIINKQFQFMQYTSLANT